MESIRKLYRYFGNLYIRELSVDLKGASCFSEKGGFDRRLGSGQQVVSQTGPGKELSRPDPRLDIEVRGGC